MTAKNDEVGTGQGDRVPEYLIERLVAGDLSPARAEDVRRRLALEPDGTARLDELTASNARILEDHPPRVIAVEVHRRALAARPAARRRVPRWGFAIGAPTVAMAAVALVLWLRPPVAPTDDGRDTTGGVTHDETLKGLKPSLRVYRKNARRIERLEDGAPAHAGDQLQVAYLAAGHKFGVVLSVDGTGQVTFHLPPTGGKAARLGRGEVALPEAYELDAAPGFERFLLVAGDAPFDTSSLTAVIRGTGPTPAGTVATWFTVRKE